MCMAQRGLIEEILDGPVVGGMLDDDFYTETMGQFVHERHPDVEVVLGLKNRSKERLAESVGENELGDELTRLQARRFTRTELHYVLGTDEYGDRMFRTPYIRHLEAFQMTPFDLSARDGQFHLQFPGQWKFAMRWEVPALATINGLRTRNRLRGMSSGERDLVIATGITRLWEKIRTIRKYPKLTFTDFGTRRRFHRAWQRYVVKTLRDELPGQFLGTSNTEAAMDFGVMPMGTNAHQLYMVIAAILSATDESLVASHNLVLREWWNLYGWTLSIALTDTFGSDFFFRDFTAKQAEEWKGLRQDSGDPVAFGHKALAFYRKHGINPMDKLLIFSDGLDMEMIVRLWLEFEGQIKVSFGWGTLLTNDLGLSAISIVIKVLAARLNADSPWVGTVKLSDNIEKAMGSAEDIERYKRVFQYLTTYAAECRV